VSGTGPDGPDTDDELGGLGGLNWSPVGQTDDSGWPGGRRSARIVAAADVLAIVVTLTVIVATLIAGRPLGGLNLLLAPGILLLIVGQVCAIVLVRARRLSGTGRRRYRGSGSISQDLDSYFGPLDRRAAVAVTVLCFVGLLSFITGIFFTFHGSPVGPGGGCAYRLSSHGVTTCVSASAYRLAGAAQQRMVVGIFVFFYAIHVYAALAASELNWSGRSPASRAGDPR
jgi:hypothetical protein